MTPEGRVKAKVSAALKALGSDCWKFMPVQTGYGAPSLDFMLCIRGRFIAIETKVKGKKLTPRQEATKAAMEAAGALVLVVDDDESLSVALQIILFEEFGVKPWTKTPASLSQQLAANSVVSRATRAATQASKND